MDNLRTILGACMYNSYRGASEVMRAKGVEVDWDEVGPCLASYLEAYPKGFYDAYSDSSVTGDYASALADAYDIDQFDQVDYFLDYRVDKPKALLVGYEDGYTAGLEYSKEQNSDSLLLYRQHCRY